MYFVDTVMFSRNVSVAMDGAYDGGSRSNLGFTTTHSYILTV